MVVSIPFKRESTCARQWNFCGRGAQRRFHSLQTGKHMCTILRSIFSLSFFTCVSIPFKRESTCALNQFPSVAPAGSSFHSLQTGKHMCTELQDGDTVEWYGFHSLQTGKHMCTAFGSKPRLLLNPLFPFPSNGKAHVHPFFRENRASS